MIFRILTFLIVLPASAILPMRGQAPPAQEKEQEQTPVFRTGVSDVRVVVQVTDGSEVVKGLTKADFVLNDEDQPQEIAYFEPEKEPLSLLLLLDISGSMKLYVDQMSETAREALQHLVPGDRIAIMTFGIHSNLHFGFFDNHAEVARQLQTATDDQDKDGYGTAINAAVIDATKYIGKDDSPGRRSILIVTDNLGVNFQANDGLAIGYLLKTDVVLNAIVVGRGIRPSAPKGGADPDYTAADVFRLAEATGGEAVKVDQAATFFPQMVSRIRDRYTLAYHVPPGSKPGQFRHIAVSLSPAAKKLHPNAVVHARLGYYVKE